MHPLRSNRPRAICTVLLDLRDPLLHSERTQSFAADPVYGRGEVFAYVGRNQNLKDLKDAHLPHPRRTPELEISRHRVQAPMLQSRIQPNVIARAASGG